MTEPRKWRVAVVALNAEGLFLVERLSLDPEIQVVGVFEQNPVRRKLIGGDGYDLRDRAAWPSVIDQVDAICFMDHASPEELSLALESRKQVVIAHPWTLPSASVSKLAQTAAGSGSVATYACPQRWDADFATAWHVHRGGRMGTLRSVRNSSFEQRIPGEGASASVLHEFGFPLFDQLLQLVDSIPASGFAKRFSDVGQSVDHGFLAVIEFANGCTAQIEVQTRSRISYRTGWVLEGLLGSFRNDRLYTVAADGEIVDEQLPTIPVGNQWISELISSWRGESTALPSLSDAANVMQLVDAVTQAANDRTVVVL